MAIRNGGNAIADLLARDALAERRDPADGLDAEDVRERDREARHALANVDVEMVQRARGDVEQHLSRAGLGIRDSASRRTSRPPNSSKTTAFTDRSSPRETPTCVYV